MIRRAIGWVWLLLLFGREWVRSVWDVAITVLFPQRVTQSAIVAIPLDVKTDGGITLLANMITLTPGTTTLHVSDDRSVLYAHVLNVTPNTVAGIKQGFERRVLEVLG
ncbi:MAG: Na+/H+ antiporter subunit E [Gemmatimonadales bacterium]|nr:Na+/H+ antiporter subunit E [Gemmatimonadales bacterium]